MKKKILCILLSFLLALPCLYYPLKAKAVAPVPVPFLYTAWDSTVSAFGALKGLQYGQNASTPEIVGDYTKPYQYQLESITPLKPSWDSFKNTWIADNFAGIYPALSEEDAKNALDKQWDDFDNAIGVQGFIDLTSPIYNAFQSWISSLVGTEYIASKTETMDFTIDSLEGPYNIPITGAGQVKYVTLDHSTFEHNIFYHGALTGIAISPFHVTSTSTQKHIICVTYHKDGFVDALASLAYIDGNSLVTLGQGWGWKDDIPAGLSGYASYGTDLNGNIITGTNTVPVEGAPVETTPAEIIDQYPVGNPNDNNDKDNKKIAVLPNVPSLKDNLNNLGNVNGGKLHIRFPVPDSNTGLIPSIPVLGNNGVTINIPVTNNNYQVINNYDQHQEIYNENNSYPTINYNYVNYYINEGAMTYEQFLQALQKYFNVIVYNNETNNYYPSTINNTTNNYYTIEEVIQEEIPPILPPSRIAITDRFPFCLPFDIYKILVLFNAEPKAWEWDVPVPTFKSGGTSTDNYHGEIGHIDYSETMHISLEQWEPVAVVLRIALGVLWLLYLCFLFQKLVH